MHKLALAALLTMAPVLTRAADRPVRDWDVVVAPYLWAMGVHGDVTFRGTSSDVDADFSDILKQLNFGAMGITQVRWRRLLFLVDGLYAQLEDEVSKGSLHVDVTLDQAIVDAKAGFRVLDLPMPGVATSRNDARRLIADLLAGGRYWYLKGDLGLDLPDLDASKTIDWVDPVVGARVRVDLSDRLSLGVLADFGGFGVGSACDSTWNLFGALGWKASERWSLHLGYKILDIERTNGSGASRVKTDMQLSGFVLGAAYHF